MDSELTKINKEEEERISKEDSYGYVYSASNYRKLLSCNKPSFGDEIDIISYKIRLDNINIISDYACSDKYCSFMFIDYTIDIGLPECITHIGDYAFKGRCLNHVRIPKNLVYMGKNPFAQTDLYNVKSFNERYVVRDNCIIDINENKLIHNVVENGVFTIPSDIKEIGEYSFSRKEVPYKKLYFHIEEDTMEVVVSSSVQKIGDYAFKNCNLRNITFIGKPTYIGLSIFENCTFLEKIFVPQGTKSFFMGLLHEYADKIDDRGDSVNRILFKNLLSSKGFEFFYRINCQWKSNVYGYIRNNHFYFSDEQGKELSRVEVGFPNGVLVFEVQDEQYFTLEEDTNTENDVLAINSLNEITWFTYGEDKYHKVADNQIIIHRSEVVEDDYSYDKEVEHYARFFGDNSDIDLTAIDANWYYYKENEMIRVLHKGELHIETFNYIEPHFYSSYFSTNCFIVVSKEDKWGFFTINGEYVEPKYSSVDCLDGNSDFYIIQEKNGCYGVVNVYGEEIIKPSNKEFTVRGYLNERPNLIAISERYIYMASQDYYVSSKGKYSYSCWYEEIPEIDKSKVSRIDVSRYFRFRRMDKEECKFIFIYKDDGKYFVYNEHCFDVTHDDEFYEWEEEVYGTETIYGVPIEEGQQMEEHIKEENDELHI